MVTTIQLDETTKEMLDKIKVHYRESYNELIRRLLSDYRKGTKESLIETIEVLSEPETMRDIAKALEEYERGKGTKIEDFKKEIGL